jgi:hypothetical protein
MAKPRKRREHSLLQQQHINCCTHHVYAVVLITLSPLPGKWSKSLLHTCMGTTAVDHVMLQKIKIVAMLMTL